jgi:hypothetical protein
VQALASPANISKLIYNPYKILTTPVTVMVIVVIMPRGVTVVVVAWVVSRWSRRVRCRGGRAVCGVAVTAVALYGVVVMVAVIVPCGVAVTVVALRGAAVTVTVIARSSQSSRSQSLHIITIMPLSSWLVVGPW